MTGEQQNWEKEFSDTLYPYIHSELTEDEVVIERIKDFVRKQIRRERARFIADLYGCRAKMVRPILSESTGNPLTLGEPQGAEEMLRYNWMNTIIAKLTDEYDVKFEDISSAIRTIAEHEYVMTKHDTRNL